MKAWVSVTLKPDVLDPQGKAIARASAQLGHDSVRSVRQGKLFEIEFEASDEATARRLLEDFSEKLLANPVIEDYRVVSIEP